MIRMLNLILLGTTLVALVAVYAIKFQAEGTAREKASLERKIAEQQSDLSILRADWAYVNQPGYVEPIIKRHAEELKLAQIGSDQFIRIEDLPFRPLPPSPPDDDAMNALFEAIAAGTDPIAALIEAN